MLKETLSFNRDVREGAYVARQPILNAGGKVFGYELLYRAAAADASCREAHDVAAAAAGGGLDPAPERQAQGLRGRGAGEQGQGDQGGAHGRFSLVRGCYAAAGPGVSAAQYSRRTRAPGK